MDGEKIERPKFGLSFLSIYGACKVYILFKLVGSLSLIKDKRIDNNCKIPKKNNFISFKLIPMED
jgi:hypothetical protein